MEKQRDLNLQIEECIQKINELCGDANRILDAVIEFDNDSYEMYKKLREELIRKLSDVVRTTLQMPDLKQFYEYLPDTAFWNEIEAVVQKRTEGFLNAVSYNQLETKERLRLVKDCFKSIFVEREGSDYIAEQINDEKTAKILYGIMMESEYAIITLYVSKRRYMVGMKEAYGLAQEDMECIWNLFESNQSIVERHEHHRRMFLLTRKLNEVNEKIQDLQEDFELLLSSEEVEDKE